MVGSSQNIALPNIVLNTAIAKEFKEFADILESAENFDIAVAQILKDTFTAHRKVIFSGKVQHKDEDQISIVVDSVRPIENSNVVTLTVKKDIPFKEECHE